MKIVLLEPIGITPDEINTITKDFAKSNHDFIAFSSRPINESEIIQRVKDAEVIILSNIPISENVINHCPKLRFISVAFAGVDHIPVEFCKKKNILVSNAAGYSTHAVAELTIGMAISLIRKIVWADNQTRNEKSREGYLGSELYGKNFGIIGFGKIGEQVADLAKAFGCNILVYNRSKKLKENTEFVDLNELLQKSDIVSLHLPLKDETKNLIGKNELDQLKSTAILINTSRGQIVDYNALYNVLKTEKIAGAALDVYEKEPPLDKNYPLFDLPNVLLLPHIGYATKEAIEYRGKIVFDNIHSWLIGNPQNIAN